MAEVGKTEVVTANRLVDGLVVYLTWDGGWSRRIADAWLARDEAATERLVALAGDPVNRRIVVGPYAIEVAVEDGAVKPVRLREVIRATGPTVGANSPALAQAAE